MSAAPAPGADRDERLARVALGIVTEPGDARVARLVAGLGARALHEELATQSDLAGLRTEVAQRLAAADPEAVLTAAARRGIRFVVPGDGEWPAGVDDLATAAPVTGVQGPPLGLWVRGERDLAEISARAVAVVGSRSATTYGTDQAMSIGADLAQAGVTVVSGAAYGIDAAAHRGALAARAPTVAVLACGVDRAYPSGHHELLRTVAAEGALVSELAPGCAPTRYRFLARNRLIAALTSGTVVVEAAVRSGALNTATWASRLNRVVMGVPGPVTSAPSEGVHELLRSGVATLVSRGEHVLELVSPSGEHLTTRPRAPETAFDRLPELDRRVLEAVPLVHPAPAASIARTAGLAPAAVTESVGRLVRLGWLEVTNGRLRRSPGPPS